jgi:hypothetical protein
MGLKNLLVRSKYRKAFREFERATREPGAHDQASWRRLRELMRRSEYWGPRLSASARLEDLEITHYETYRPALDKAISGRISPFTGEEILYWCESSGTTGPKKHFPITASFRDEFMRISPANVYSLASRFPGFPDRKVMYFAASAPQRRTPAGIDVGFISHFNFRNLPPNLRRTYAFPLELFSSSEVFDAWSPCYALADDISAIFAITPAMVHRLARSIEERGPELLPYLSGEKSLPDGLPPLAVSRKRLERVRRVLSQKPFDFREAWPGLQFVSCWTSSLCALQTPALKPHLGGVPLIDSIYSATEGWLTLPLSSTETGGVLFPGGHIFEFVEAGRPVTRANVIPASGLEAGKTYEVLVTSGMGFIRYRLFDLVLCKGHHGRSPVLEFLHKSGNMISIGQVRFNEGDLVGLLRDSGARLPERWSFSTSAEGDRLVLYVSSELEQGFGDRFEDALLQSHEEYLAEIKNRLMRPFEVRTVPRGNPFWGSSDHAQGKPRAISPAPPL